MGLSMEEVESEPNFLLFSPLKTIYQKEHKEQVKLPEPASPWIFCIVQVGLQEIMVSVA